MRLTAAQLDAIYGDIPIGTTATTRAGERATVVAVDEDKQLTLDFGNATLAKYYPNEVTLDTQSSIEQHPKWQTTGAELHVATMDYPELEDILSQPPPAISVAASKVATVHGPFADSGEAYNATQTDENIHDGDIVETQDGSAAILMQAWPVSIKGDAGQFHTLAEGASWDTLEGGRYKSAVDSYLGKTSSYEPDMDEIGRGFDDARKGLEPQEDGAKYRRGYQMALDAKVNGEPLVPATAAQEECGSPHGFHAEGYEPWSCTLPKGHEGGHEDHRSKDRTGEIFAWPKTSASTEERDRIGPCPHCGNRLFANGFPGTPAYCGACQTHIPLVSESSRTRPDFFSPGLRSPVAVQTENEDADQAKLDGTDDVDDEPDFGFGVTASETGTIYRGIKLDVGLDDAPGILHNLLDRNLSAVANKIFELAMQDGHLGWHWSLAFKGAERFAALSSDLTVGVNFTYWYLPVIFEGQYLSSDVEWRQDQLEDGVVSGYSWEGKEEYEVPLRKGAPVSIEAVHVFVPEDLEWALTVYEGDSESLSLPGHWIRIPVSRQVTASLGLEDVISVAEQSMERLGQAGREIEVPTGHQDDPRYQEAIAPLRSQICQWASAVGLDPSTMRIYASSYSLGGAQAMVSETGAIVTQPHTNEMTILHELAHLVHHSHEGSGHDVEFARTARDLYGRFISPSAAETFWNIVGPYVDGKTAAQDDERATEPEGYDSNDIDDFDTGTTGPTVDQTDVDPANAVTASALEDYPTFPGSVFHPVPFLAAAKMAYIEAHPELGAPGNFHIDYSKVAADPITGKEIAEIYRAAPIYDPDAQPAYDQLIKEVAMQYDYLTKTLGVTVEVSSIDPYRNVGELIHDIMVNRHQYTLSTATTGHKLMLPTGRPIMTDAENDRFRAVHDAFGHAASGRAFDRNGEAAAWVSHMQMLSPLAGRAVTTETHARNSVLIYGTPDQKTGPAFAAQKVFLLPIKYSDTDIVRTDVTPTTHTAAWADVQEKAARIRAEGRVRVLSVTGPYIAGHVQGDNGVYETTLQRGKNGQIDQWTCSCPWFAYSFGRSGRWKKYEGRMCSHALALQYQAQSEGMFGRDVKERAEAPGWDKGDITYYTAPPQKEWRSSRTAHYYYHAAPTSNRADIEREGLRTDRASLWHDAPGVYLFDGVDEEEGFDQADTYGSMMLPKVGVTEYDIWQVDLDPSEVTSKGAGAGALVYRGNVAPDKIRRVGFTHFSMAASEAEEMAHSLIEHWLGDVSYGSWTFKWNKQTSAFGETSYRDKTISLSKPLCEVNNSVVPLYAVAEPLPGEALARQWALSPSGSDFMGQEVSALSRKYRDLPILDRSAVGLWTQLGQICVEQMRELQKTWDIQVLDIDPYNMADEMHADIAKRIYKVTTLHSHHPVWDVDTNVAFRVCHDIYGHGRAHSDFSFHGEVLAFQYQCDTVPEDLWEVLFTEVVAQSAYANTHHLFGEQKVGLIDISPEDMLALVGEITDAPDPAYDALHFSATLGESEEDPETSEAAESTADDEWAGDTDLQHAAGLSDQYLQTGVPTTQDELDLIASYVAMHGKLPSQSELDRLRSKSAADHIDPHSGLMVAVRPPESVCRALLLDQDDAEPFDQLHVTIVYIPEDMMVESDLPAIQEVVLREAQSSPFSATISGYGQFPAEENPVTIAMVGSDELHRLRDRLVDALAERGIGVSNKFPYSPHITLTYGECDIDSLPPVNRDPFLFDGLIISPSSGVWERYPFAGGVVATLEDEPEGALPYTDGTPDEPEETYETDEQNNTHLGQSDQNGNPVPSWLMRSNSNQGVGDDMNIAAAARNYLLTSTAVKSFTYAEQQEIINEGEGITASNLDRLRLEGTHYEQLEAQLAAAEANGEPVIWWD